MNLLVCDSLVKVSFGNCLFKLKTVTDNVIKYTMVQLQEMHNCHFYETTSSVTSLI